MFFVYSVGLMVLHQHTVCPGLMSLVDILFLICLLSRIEPVLMIMLALARLINIGKITLYTNIYFYFFFCSGLKHNTLAADKALMAVSVQLINEN